AEDRRFVTNSDRVANKDALIEQLNSIFAEHAAEDWLEVLTEAGSPSGKVRSIDEVYEWDQVLSQGLRVEVDHATKGRLSLPGPVLRLDDNDYGGARKQNIAPPTLGQHNASARAWPDETEDEKPADQIIVANVTGMRLAGGSGSRMGKPKALVRRGDGTPWLATARRALLDGGCSDVLTVLGARADDARALIPDAWTVSAANWHEGMSASLAVGLRELRP